MGGIFLPRCQDCLMFARSVAGIPAWQWYLLFSVPYWLRRISWWMAVSAVVGYIIDLVVSFVAGPRVTYSDYDIVELMEAWHWNWIPQWWAWVLGATMLAFLLGCSQRIGWEFVVRMQNKLNWPQSADGMSIRA